MNRDQIKGHWKQLEGEARRTWAKLTDDDWQLAQGDLDILAGRIQERYGDAKEVVMGQIGKILHRLCESAEAAIGHPRALTPTPAVGHLNSEQ